MQVIRMQQITDLKASNAPQTAISAMQHDYQDLVDAEEELKGENHSHIRKMDEITDAIMKFRGYTFKTEEHDKK